MLERFFKAIANLRQRKLSPSVKNSPSSKNLAQLLVTPPIRQFSFYISTVENAKVSAEYLRLITDCMEGAVEEVNGPYGKQTAYKVGGQADFIEQAREYLQKEGLDDGVSPLDNKITNPASDERLKLIFNTHIQQSQQLASWQSHVEDPDFIDRYPAARFVRMPGATTPRQRHVEAEGQVRRWDDFAFWLFQNAPDIGGFDVPWGPWGLNSYMHQEPVKRAEAERLGLVKSGEIIKPIDVSQWGITPTKKLKQNAKANLPDTPPTIRKEGIAELRAQLGSDIVDDNGKISLDAFRRLRAEIESTKASK